MSTDRRTDGHGPQESSLTENKLHSLRSGGRRESKRAGQPFRWLRRLLLLLALFSVGGVVLSYFAFRFGDRTQTAIGVTSNQENGIDAEARTTSSGFDLVQRLEGEPVLRIRAEKSRLDENEVAFLDVVTVDIYREDGGTYRVTSDTARVNESQKEAVFRGNVVISGWGDLQLESRAMALRDQGQILKSLGAVEFTYPPNLIGRASALLIDRRTDSISMSEGVHVRTIAGAKTPMRLDSQRFVYKRGENLIQAVEDVFLRNGKQSISSHYLLAELDEQGETFRNLIARWDVVAESGDPTAPWEGRIRLEGQFLNVATDLADDTKRKVVIEGSKHEGVRLAVADGTGFVRRLEGTVIETEIRNGELVSTDAVGDPLVLTEYLDAGEPFYLRQACARQGRLGFLAGGELAQVALQDEVELRTEDVHLSGGKTGIVDAQSGKLELRGPEVMLHSARGDLSAPRVVYSRQSGWIRAYEGVHTELKGASLEGFSGTPLGQGDGPLRVDSTEAVLEIIGGEFSFQGEVTAWRGGNILNAERLRGNADDRELSASGTVRTVWKAQATGEDSPIEIASDLLTYREAEGLVVYTGEVLVDHSERSVDCRELTVVLTRSDRNGSSVQRMVCKDDIVLRDAAEGNRVTGDVAVYDLIARTIEIAGEEVELIDSSLSEMQGRYLLYDLESGRIQLRGEQPVEFTSEPRARDSR